MRCLIAIAVIASAACSLKFPDKHEGTFACQQDSDCTSPFICKGGTCVDLNGAARCNPPTITGASTPAIAQYVGFSYTLNGTAVSNDPTCPLGTDTAWLVCDAPGGSAFAATDGTNCTHLADGDTATFTPDVHGTYNLTLRATAGDATGTGIVPLEVLADALFVELSYLDSRTLQALIHAQISSACYDLDQTACGTHPECIYSAAFGTCWTNCAPLDQTACNNASGQCTYNTSGPSCDSALNQSAACIVRTTRDACSAITNCIFADTGFCHADCSKLTVDTDCTGADCTWDATSSTCTGNDAFTSAAGFNETTIAQLYTDGSQVAPLSYGGTAQYRYDPNGVFTDVQLGTGISSASTGLAYDPVTRIALVPHLYVYETPPVNGAIQCRTAMNMLVWRQGATFGQAPPGGVQPLIAPNTNNTTDTMATTVNHSVGYPRLVTRDSGTVRFVYGDAIDTVDITSSDEACTAPDGSSNIATAFSLAPLFAQGLGPLLSRTPMPLFIGEAGAQQSGASFPLTSKHIVASAQPCRTDYDCGLDAGGTQVVCSSGTCASSFNAEGYLPQLMAKGDALAYSHVTCGSAYGAACSSGEYDLMLAKVVANAGASIATDFQLHNMILVSAEPGVAELDAFVPGDIFSDLTDIYYLTRSDQPITVNVSDSGTPGTSTQSLPVFSLHSRQLNRNASSGGWTVTPAPTSAGTLVVDGTLTLVDISSNPLPCALDGVAGRVVLQGATIHNPLEFAFSPDGRYLAYADATVATACETPIFSSTSQLAASEVTGSTLKFLDLASLNPTPQDLIPASCLTQFNMQGEAQLMPTWVANGAQLVFNSHLGTSKDIVNNRFFRMNTVDLGATDCHLVELLPSGAAAQALAGISSTLTAKGLSLVDSRTGQFACISCAGAGPEGAALLTIVAVGALWRASRRRGVRAS